MNSSLSKFTYQKNIKMRIYYIFVLILTLTNAFDFSSDKKKEVDNSINIGKIYNIEDINHNMIQNALKNVELLKKNNINILLNKYFEEIDNNIEQLIIHNPLCLMIYYPSLYWLYNSLSNKIRPENNEKHIEAQNYFRDFTTNTNILYKNESLLLYYSEKEDVTEKLLFLNIIPQKCFSILELSSEKKSIYETHLIFETQNLNFKSLIQNKFKNAKNIIFENYYYIIIF